jgi:deoxyhypusine synthase
VLFDYNVLLDTDAFVREVIQGPSSSADGHGRISQPARQVRSRARQKKLGIKDSSSAGDSLRVRRSDLHQQPGDSSIGMNVAAMALRDSKLMFDVNRDVNQTAGIVYHAKSTGHTSSVFILGGGSPKNFMLQTEPQIQEVMGIKEKGHDYFLQCTDARPDTGGLSGATPAEAVSWGKVDPDKLPDSVVCYTDSTIALPLVDRLSHGPRKAAQAQASVRFPRHHPRQSALEIPLHRHGEQSDDEPQDRQARQQRGIEEVIRFRIPQSPAPSRRAFCIWIQ